MVKSSWIDLCYRRVKFNASTWRIKDENLANMRMRKNWFRFSFTFFLFYKLWMDAKNNCRRFYKSFIRKSKRHQRRRTAHQIDAYVILGWVFYNKFLIKFCEWNENEEKLSLFCKLHFCLFVKLFIIVTFISFSLVFLNGFCNIMFVCCFAKRNLHVSMRLFGNHKRRSSSDTWSGCFFL